MHGDYMSGLSSVMAITRPLGEVNLAAMNRCTGVYRVYLNGGGGGGGGFNYVSSEYGGAGYYGDGISYTGSLIPPITLYPGEGGMVGDGYDEDGGDGGETFMGDSRVAIIMLAPGGAGGTSVSTERSLYPVTPRYQLATLYSRFTMSFPAAPPSTPYFTVATGNGGDSLSAGGAGGIIKAFRVG